ncbi:hypothetical protein ZOSMA_160G00190 [Zostera marina]|uniref:Uncharacterized protein n=1 Tax=Zostera marina TaxID=29655 RepID=A0A0K9PWR8_ZOSMR|nr:hypothetical protein ZOSMA_160G00190 [Zostera marina]
MAGGNFLARAISYVVNEIVVEGLANNHSFQRFAVRTSKALEEVSTKVVQAKQEIAQQVKDMNKNSDMFK